MQAGLEPAYASESQDGMTFGPYEVVELIGAGGMGEVYKARDTRLQRDVAIKVLRSIDADSSTWERFQREARAASALSHPNICTVHDVGEANGQPYLVMELLEGVTLRVHMGEKALKPQAALAIATQIAGALEAAHAKGIVHRDIKPANVMITGSGYIKVLDFSLARQTGSGVGEARIGGNPTLESLSAEGTVAGTPHYLSPEALQGARADVRSDLWALGVVLYQMLSGRLPFKGVTMIELSEAILKDPAPALPPGIPAALRAIVDRCLRKRPEERYQNAGEIRAALEPLPSGALTRRRWLWTAGAAAALAAGVFIWQQVSNGSSDPLEGVSPQRLTNFEGDEVEGVISPDGGFVGFVSNRYGTYDIWMLEVAARKPYFWTKGGSYDAGTRNLVRNMGFTADGSVWYRTPADRASGPAPLLIAPRSLESAPRRFLESDAGLLAWSADRKRLVYMRNAQGGDPIYVADSDGANAKKIFGDGDKNKHNHLLAWSPDGAWIYFTRGVLGTHKEFDIWRISPTGADAEQLTHHYTEVGYPIPIDKRTLLYLARDEDGLGPWIWALDVKTKRNRRISSGSDEFIALSGTADGRRIVATIAKTSADLWAVPILADREAKDGDMKAFDVPETQRASAPRFGGESLFFLSSSDGRDGLWRRYRDEKPAEVWKGSNGALLEPSVVSRDGKQIAIVRRRNGRPVWHIGLADGTAVRSVGEHLDIQGSATWAPDGKALLAGGKDAEGPGLFLIPADGGAPTRLISADARNPAWSAEADLIVYSAGATVSGYAELHAVRPNGDSFPLPQIDVNGISPQAGRFLPDGKGMIYRLNTNFWYLDLATKEKRQLTQLSFPAEIGSFDITPDGKQIVFDRLRRNSDIYLFDLPPQPWYRGF